MAPQISKAQQKVLRVATATPEEEQGQDLRDEVAAIALLGEAEQALTQAPLTEALIIEGSAKVLGAWKTCNFELEASDALCAALENKAAVAAALAAQGPGSLCGPAALLLYEAAALSVSHLAVEGQPGGARWMWNVCRMMNRLIAALQQERMQAQVQRVLEQVGSPVTPGFVLAFLLAGRIGNYLARLLGGSSLWLDAQQ